MNTYKVPVTFTITAPSAIEAWWRIRDMIAELEENDQLPEYVIEDATPVEDTQEE
jgi:hypothetical protein